ncbi:PadR family transcriptional regulator [Magnetospirillum fulvum]|uniref:DNA-binding transcriptional regulator, PadR family n=1 Tax=Magnetospirillum fulvum TaxID=1082 RepID=A0A1H6HWD8_MAGFU|nr:PadR family transcriptional regulator [Magnetospirillum fulvum]SEH40369.1 DNA-binding transcriptional regulator, PadR family [Magnetospirillum fulvum]
MIFGWKSGRRAARDEDWTGQGNHGGGGDGLLSRLHRHHRGGGGGSRLGRLFAHGDLHLVVLHLIAEKPRHGYEIIKAIAAMVCGSYSPSPGTIYPALTMLEDQGFVTVEASDGNRKLYRITPEGQAYLAANRGTVALLLDRMAAAGAAQAEAASPPVIRAVENLKLALRLRLERGPLSDTQIATIAAALDRAAAEIERS